MAEAEAPTSKPTARVSDATGATAIEDASIHFRLSDHNPSKSALSLRVHSVSRASLLSNSSSHEEEEQTELATVNEQTFWFLGIVVLLLQALAVVVFSVYSWSVQNFMVGISGWWGVGLWLGVVQWKLTLAYRSHRWLTQASSVLLLLSFNPMLQFRDDPRVGGFTGALVCWLVLGSLAVGICYWTWSQLCRCVQTVLVPDQGERNQVVMASLMPSLKASIVIVYVQAEALARIGNNSLQDFGDAQDVLDDPTQSWEDHHQAEELFRDLNEGARAIVAGLTLNASLYFAFVLAQTCFLQMNDVVTWQLTTWEKVLLASVAMTVLDAVVFLGVLGSTTGSTWTNWSVFLALLHLALFSGLVASGMIARSILRGRHGYIELRRNRNGQQGILLREEAENFLFASA